MIQKSMALSNFYFLKLFLFSSKVKKRKRSWELVKSMHSFLFLQINKFCVDLEVEACKSFTFFYQCLFSFFCNDYHVQTLFV